MSERMGRIRRSQLGAIDLLVDIGCALLGCMPSMNQPSNHRKRAIYRGHRVTGRSMVKVTNGAKAMEYNGRDGGQ